MALVGYARVSTSQQDPTMQVDALEAAGCIRVFTEKKSGKNIKDRAQLQECLAYLRDNNDDALVVWRMDRLGRNLAEVVNLMDSLEKRGIGIVSLQESLDSRTSTGRVMMQMMAVMAEAERSWNRERVQAANEARRARGRQGGRPRKSSKDIEQAITLYKTEQVSLADIQTMTGVSSSTLYRYLKAEKEQQDRVGE